MNETALESEDQQPPVRELTRLQRRVLGVLLEKAFTTPEYYPLTLKAVATGCNQKSNRSPLMNLDEDDIADTLEELRELGLVAVVHTESGRTERYRHYVRKRYTFSEPQLAILTELLLRGRQTLGELRSRASRMVPIESLDDLRHELTGLRETKYVQATDDLERRGVEVDHSFYTPKENARIGSPVPQPPSSQPVAESTPMAATVPQPESSRPVSERPAASLGETRPHQRAETDRTIEELRLAIRELRQELESVKADVERQTESLDELRRDLGA